MLCSASIMVDVPTMLDTAELGGSMCGTSEAWAASSDLSSGTNGLWSWSTADVDLTRSSRLVSAVVETLTGCED